MIHEQRNIKSIKSRSAGEIRALIESLFVLELVSPSESLWIVSAWLTNLAVVDNSAGKFSSIVPEWGATKIYFVDVLVDIMSRGTRVVVATNKDPHNRTFHRRLAERVDSHGVRTNYRNYVGDDLHIKGMLSDSFWLSGSMNFTHNGVNINEEDVTLHVNESVVAKSRIDFRDAYGK